MAWPFEWVMGWRYTRQGRAGRRNGFLSFISAVSMLGIALGVAALIIVMSVVNGFQREVRERMLAVVSHIKLFEPGGRDMPLQALQAQQVLQHPGVRAVAPYVGAQGLLARGEDMKAAQLRGIDPPQEARVTSKADPALLTHLQPGSLNVLLGNALVQSLGVAVGDTMSWLAVRGQRLDQNLPRVLPLTVVGTLDTGHFEYDATLAQVNLTDAASMLGLGIAYNIDNLVPALERLFGTTFLSKDVHLIDHMASDPQRGDVIPVGLISLTLALLATLYADGAPAA